MSQTPSNQPQCSDVEIKKYIERLNRDETEPSVIDALVACGAKALPAFINALNDAKPTVRSRAASALARINQGAN